VIKTAFWIFIIKSHRKVPAAIKIYNFPVIPDLHLLVKNEFYDVFLFHRQMSDIPANIGVRVWKFNINYAYYLLIHCRIWYFGLNHTDSLSYPPKK